MIEVGELVPSYITVDPTGKVGANFTGKVNAQGVVLPSTVDSSVTDVSAIEWRQTSDQALVAFMQGFSTAGEAAGVVVGEARTPTDTSSALLIAEDDQGAIRALLRATQNNRGNGAINALVGAVAVVIITAQGTSQFLQSTSTGLSAADDATLTWPGGSPISNELKITLTGATGTVEGVATAGIVGAAYFTVRRVRNFDGTVSFFGRTVDGSSPAAAATGGISYLIWGN